MLIKDIPGARHASIIDVRSREEYDLGHPKGAVNIPWDLLRYYMDELKALPKPWIFVCEEGVRSGWVVFSLKMLGFDDIFNGGRWLDTDREMAEVA